MFFRGVSGYLKLGGQVVMWRAAAAAPPPGGAFYSAKNWVGNCPPCPPCPPATYAPDICSRFDAYVVAKVYRRIMYTLAPNFEANV